MSIDTLSDINPMIHASSYRVCSALEALAALLDRQEKIELDEVQSYGVAVFLQTCAAALRQMDDIQNEMNRCEVSA